MRWRGYAGARKCAAEREDEMQRGMDYQGYTGSRPMMPMAPWYGGGMMAQGCCRKCGQPSAACCCGCRECRREAKELLVAASAIRQGASDEQGPFPTSGLSIIRSLHADALDSAAKDVLAAAAARGLRPGPPSSAVVAALLSQWNMRLWWRPRRCWWRFSYATRT